MVARSTLEGFCRLFLSGQTAPGQTNAVSTAACLSVPRQGAKSSPAAPWLLPFVSAAPPVSMSETSDEDPRRFLAARPKRSRKAPVAAKPSKPPAAKSRIPQLAATDPAAMMQMKAVELREWAAFYQLPTSGNKADLVKRLVSHRASTRATGAAAAASSDDAVDGPKDRAAPPAPPAPPPAQMPHAEVPLPPKKRVGPSALPASFPLSHSWTLNPAVRSTLEKGEACVIRHETVPFHNRHTTYITDQNADHQSEH